MPWMSMNAWKRKYMKGPKKRKEAAGAGAPPSSSEKPAKPSNGSGRIPLDPPK